MADMEQGHTHKRSSGRRKYFSLRSTEGTMTRSCWILVMALLLQLIVTVAESKCPSLCRCSLGDRGRKKVTCQNGGMRDSIPIGEMSADTQILIVTAPKDVPNQLSLGPIFKGLRELEEIHIMWSAVPNLGAHSFWGLKELKTLNLTHNSLSTLMDTNFKGLASLKHLDMSYNLIESVPSAVFRHVRHLHSLSLANNRISSLVTRIFFGLSRLEHLDLSNNPIKELQPELFSDVPVLKKFSCAACDLSEIKENILIMIPEVKDLNLRDNFLTQIPQGLAALTSLISIRLDGNRITQIDQFTFTDSPVSHVHLAHNDIMSIDVNAFSNFTLTHLDLSYNRLSDLSTDGFPDVLPNLKELQLSGNPLQTDKVFEMLSNAKQLHHLGLGDIGLSEVPTVIGHGRGLHSLNLSSNYISVLPHELFSSSPHLRLLDISSNIFEGIGDDVLEAITRAKDLRILRLEGNPWKCDQCHVAPLLRWLQRSPDQESGCDEPKVWTCLKCVGPDQIKHQPLALLPLGDLPKCKTPPTKASLSQSDHSSKSISRQNRPLNELGEQEYVDILDELKIAPPLADQPVYSRNGLPKEEDESNDYHVFKNNVITVLIGALSFIVIIICIIVSICIIYNRRSSLYYLDESDGSRRLKIFRRRGGTGSGSNRSSSLVDDVGRKDGGKKEEKMQQMTELKLDEKVVEETATKATSLVIRETELV